MSEQIETMTKRRLAEVDLADFELSPKRLPSGAFQLSLVTVGRSSGERSERTLEGPTCADVTDAAAVAIALAIGTPPPDPPGAPDESAAPTSPASPAPPPDPPGAPDESAAPTSPASPAPPPGGAESDAEAAISSAPRPRVAWLVGVAGLLDSSATPRPVLGGSLHAAFSLPPLRFELQAGAFVPSQQLDASGRGGSFQLLYGAVLACATRAVGPPTALVCFGYELGQLSAEGQGVARPYERRTLWQALRPELGLSWPLGDGIAVSARVGSAIALSRYVFVLDDPEAVHRPPRFSLRAALGLELVL